VVVVVVVVVVGAALVAPAHANAAPRIRVDQLGYAPAEAKVAYVLAPRALRGARFRVTDAAGRTVVRGRVRASRGRWNRRFGAVQPLDLSTLREPGRYRVRSRVPCGLRACPGN
jgi:endoglucanase